MKYDNGEDPVKKPLLGMRHCPEDAVITVTRDNFIFHWCDHHAKDSN